MKKRAKKFKKGWTTKIKSANACAPAQAKPNNKNNTSRGCRTIPEKPATIKLNKANNNRLSPTIPYSAKN